MSGYATLIVVALALLFFAAALVWAWRRGAVEGEARATGERADRLEQEAEANAKMRQTFDDIDRENPDLNGALDRLRERASGNPRARPK